MECNKKYPIFCSFYINTKYGSYDKVANGLMRRCDELGIRNDVFTPPGIREYIRSRPTGIHKRARITRYKPTFILDSLEKWDQPIVYLDADSYINRKPSGDLFCMEHIGIDKIVGGKKYVLFNASATAMYFNNSGIVKDFLFAWKEKCDNVLDKPRVAEHYFLMETIIEFIESGNDIFQYFDEPLVKLSNSQNIYIRQVKKKGRPKLVDIYKQKNYLK